MKVPTNSATNAATSGARDRLNRTERLLVEAAFTVEGADSTAFTVVTFVVDCFFAVGFFVVDFFALEAAFLVAMYFPPLIKKYEISIA